MMNLKLTKYSWWKLSGWLVCDLGRLERTGSTEQFGLLCRHVYRKISFFFLIFASYKANIFDFYDL